jgi:oligopeptidase B
MGSLHSTRASSSAASIRSSSKGQDGGRSDPPDGNVLAKPMPISASRALVTAPTSLPFIDTKGSELYTVKIIEAGTGVLVDSRIADSNGALEWAADSRNLLYIWLDNEHRPRRVLRHQIGADTADALIHEQDDPGYFLGLDATQDRRFLLLSVHDHETAEISLIDAADPSAAPRLIAPREAEHDYSVDHHDGQLIILTNSEGAEDYRIVAAPADNLAASIGAKSSRTSPADHSRCRAYKDFLVRLEREEGLPRIVVRRFADGEEHAIAFDEAAYALGISSGYEYDTPVLRFTYSSMTTPAQVFDYDMNSRARELRKTQEIPSGHNPFFMSRAA